jgi:acyl-CoA reductase-like NAD-dependent aldehyde dehydrogenase
MRAARDRTPATVRPRGGHDINFIWHDGDGNIEVRRPSDNQPDGQIPDAGAEGCDQAVRTAQDALNADRGEFAC